MPIKAVTLRCDANLRDRPRPSGAMPPTWRSLPCDHQLPVTVSGPGSPGDQDLHVTEQAAGAKTARAARGISGKSVTAGQQSHSRSQAQDVTLSSPSPMGLAQQAEHMRQCRYQSGVVAGGKRGTKSAGKHLLLGTTSMAGALPGSYRIIVTGIGSVASFFRRHAVISRP